eukprot:COSAG02_NODE_4112_length_5763_cov_3.743997_2_plen_659_part_00
MTSSRPLLAAYTALIPLGLMLGLHLAVSQPLPAASAGTCNLETLQSRIDTFNTACCTTAECFASGVCSTSCAEILLPLMAECEEVLDAVYDATDSTRDGSASMFHAGATACQHATPEPIEPVPGSHGTCDLNRLDARIEAFNNACCTSTACIPDGLCSVDCAVVLLPLVVDCGPVLDLLYDGTDGLIDGTSSTFTTGSEACLAIASTDALQRVQELHDAGICPPTVLDGVAEVEVSATCEDTNDNCQSFLAMGLLCTSLVGQCDATCLICSPPAAQQACADTNPNCAQFIASGLGCDSLNGTCDLSCNVCTSSTSDQGGHRRSRRRRRRRRAQGTSPTCDMTTVPAQIARINTVCCDINGGECATGVPTTCDAKCAVFFLDFYERCEVYISPSYSPSENIALGQLADTCAHALPAEPLLMTAAKCTGWTPGVAGSGTCKQALLQFQGGCSYDDQSGCSWPTSANGYYNSHQVRSWDSSHLGSYSAHSPHTVDDIVGFTLAGMSLNNAEGAFNGWGRDPDLDVCLWTGVTCHPTTGTVAALNLNYDSNYGPLEDSDAARTIDGDVRFLAGCQGLQVVLLHYSSATGDVATLAALTQLKVLDLYNSRVSGDVTPLARLPQLEYLSLQSTHVTGSTEPFVARGLNCGSGSSGTHMPTTCHP